MRIFFKLLLSIFAAEAAVMFLLPLLLPLSSGIVITVVDAALLTILVSPPVWWFVVRPLRSIAAFEKQLVQEKLRETNETLTALVQASPLAIMAIDSSGRVQSWNPAAGRIFGWSEQEVLGRPLPIVTREKLDEFRRLRERVVGGEVLMNVELRRRRKDGSFIDISLTAAPMRNAAGKIIGIMSVIADISERKALEETVRRITQDWEDTFNTLTDMVTVHDKDFNIIRANKAAEKILNLPFLQRSGRKCYEFYHGTDHPPECCPSCQVLKTGIPVTSELFEPHLNMHMEIRAIPRLDSAGKLAGLIHVVRDISERKKAEQLLLEQKLFAESLLQNLAIAAFVLDRDHRVLLWNKACEELTGISASEMIGSKECWKAFYDTERPCLGDVVIDGDNGKLDPPYHEYMKSTLLPNGLHAEGWYPDLGGKNRYILFDAAPLVDTRGELVAAIETIQDITAHKDLENQLRHAQKMEAVGRLSAGVAHDFNNILTAIIGYATVLQMKMTEEPLKPNVDQILASTERAAALTQSLLAFSRKQTTILKPISLRETVLRVKKLIARLIGEDVEVRTVLSGADITAMGDSGQIEQVLMNLATNARDAMPEGGRFTIETAVAELDTAHIKRYGYGKSGTYGLIAVSDSGMGMDEAARSNIFEPFYTTKEVGKGTGLGLSIVYGIVKQHNGYIHAYSEPGRGTTFKVYLPLIPAEAKTQQEAPPPLLEGGTETLLLAEDDPDLRKLTGSILAEFGYTVIEAVDGEDAVKKFADRKGTVHLVILDVIMPKKNGWEAYKNIQEMKPDTRTLFMSGYTADVIHKQGLLARNVPFILKPVSPRELLRKVRDVLAG